MRRPTRSAVLQPGTLVEGRYRVEGLIGRGGGGQVHRARDEFLNRLVALKLHATTLQTNEEGLARLRREVEALAGIRDPGVVQLYDVGRDERFGLYYTMELVEGPSLAQRIDREGALPEAEVLVLFRELLAALEAIHDAGLVHRDLTPSNILSSGERAVICDFGLVLDETATQITRTGTVLGTPTHLAPEMIREGNCDAASDLYQLGVVIYEALTGRLPYGAERLESLLREILEGGAPLPTSIRPEISPAWDGILARCLASDPAERSARARDLASELDRLFPRIRLGESSDGSRTSPSVPVPRSAGRSARRILVATALGILLFAPLAWRRVACGVGPTLPVDPGRSVRPERATPPFELLDLTLESERLVLRMRGLTAEKPLVRASRGGRSRDLAVMSEASGEVRRLQIIGLDGDEDGLELHDGAVVRDLAREIGDLACRFSGRLVASDPGPRIFEGGLPHGPGALHVVRGFLFLSKEERNRIAEQDRTRRAATLSRRLDVLLADGSFVETYGHAARIWHAIRDLRAVPFPIRHELFLALDRGRQIELLCAIEGFRRVLVEREAEDLGEPVPAPSSVVGEERILSETELVLGHDRLQAGKTFRTRAEFAFSLDDPGGLSDVELHVRMKDVRRICLAVTLNGLRVGRILNSHWFRTLQHSSGKFLSLRLRIPTETLRSGKNLLLLEPEVFHGVHASNLMKLRRIALRHRRRKG